MGRVKGRTVQGKALNNINVLFSVLCINNIGEGNPGMAEGIRNIRGIIQINQIMGNPGDDTFSYNIGIIIIQ